MKKEVYIVNAFTSNGRGGNGAGVAIHCDDLTSKDMQAIASEVGLSETAFVIKSQNPEYDYEVKFFTPTTEVDLCGHATIAAFYTLGELGLIRGKDEVLKVKQKTLAGILDVDLVFKDNKIHSVLMTQASPKFLFTVEDLKPLCEVLSISEDNIGISGFNILPMAVSTGLSDIILPVKNLKALKNINPNFEALAKYSNAYNLIGVHAFTLETENKESTAATRNFGPAAGIDEESATGTSNGALCAYLIKNNILPLVPDSSIICEQGYYMNNPSEIIASASGSLDNLIIKVGGKATVIDKKVVSI